MALGICSAHLRRVDTLLLHLSLLLAHVIVRTVRLELVIVSETAPHLLSATRTLIADILLGPNTTRPRIADILRTVTLSVENVHLGSLPEADLGQVLRRLRSVVSGHPVRLDLALVATL